MRCGLGAALQGASEGFLKQAQGCPQHRPDPKNCMCTAGLGVLWGLSGEPQNHMLGNLHSPQR